LANELTVSMCDSYRRERGKAGAAPKTVYTDSIVLRQVVNFGISRGRLVADPLRAIRLMKPTAPPQPCRTWQEVMRILDGSREPQRSIFALLAEAGMRVGELKHLTWADVDLERGLIQIRPKDGRKPKTGYQRSVPLSAATRAVLNYLPRRGRWVVTSAASTAHPKGDGLVSERRLLRALKRKLKGLGLPGHLHTFRHAFISRALIAGIRRRSCANG
jgi:integrase